MAEYNAVIYAENSTPNIYHIRFYNASAMKMSHERAHILYTELNEILSKFPKRMKKKSTRGSFTKPLRNARGANAIMLDNLTKQDFDTLITDTEAIKSHRQLGGSRRLVNKSRETHKTRHRPPALKI